MDTFELKETVKFTQLLRVKLRNQREGGRALEPAQIYDRVKVLQENELKHIDQRNAKIRRSHGLEKAGHSVNYTLFDEEAKLMKCMKNSESGRFGRLRTELWKLCERHLDAPMMLADDYALARVYKHCLTLGTDDVQEHFILGNKAIENEFYQFKEMFNSKARKEATRSDFFSLVQQIHTLKGEILSSQQKPDFLES